MVISRYSSRFGTPWPEKRTSTLEDEEEEEE
jgi:hypothetical protein